MCDTVSSNFHWCFYSHFVVLGFSDAARGSLSSTIFVGRLPPDASEDELKTHFPGCLAARIIKDKFSGISKG